MLLIELYLNIAVVAMVLFGVLLYRDDKPDCVEEAIGLFIAAIVAGITWPVWLMFWLENRKS